MGQTFFRLTLLVAGIVTFTPDAFAQKQPIGQRDEDHWRVIRAIEWEVDSLHANHVMIPLGQDETKTTKVFFGTVKCHLEYLGPNLKLELALCGLRIKHEEVTMARTHHRRGEIRAIHEEAAVVVALARAGTGPALESSEGRRR